MTEEDKFREHLKSKRLKYTPERQLILKEVFSLHKHFDVEDLFGRLQRKGKHVSMATVYRALPLLVKSGLVREAMRCEGRVCYEHLFGHKHHDHLFCLKCGRVIEFRDEDMEKLQDEICKKYGFKPVEHRLGIKGYCRRCK